MTTIDDERRVASPPHSRDTTLWTAKLTALVCSAVSALYVAAGIEPVPIVVLLFSAAPLVMVILWLQKDSYRTGVGVVQDWGFFLWLGWPALIPWYAWRTRGRRGWRLTLGLFGLILSAYLTAFIVGWILYMVS